MLRHCLVAAGVMAALPIHAAYAEDAEPQHAGRDAAAASGFRAELLAGFDTDGFNEGVLYGGRLGYDFKVGRRFLLGVDAELNDVTTDHHLQIPAGPRLTSEDGPDAYVGGRATFVLSSRFRLFAAGGYTLEKQGLFVQTNPSPAPFGTIVATERTHDGYRLGAGGQFLIGRHAFIGAEYRYSRYSEFFNQREQLIGSIGFRF
jgi:outer membrane immunogenic protein